MDAAGGGGSAAYADKQPQRDQYESSDSSVGCCRGWAVEYIPAVRLLEGKSWSKRGESGGQMTPCCWMHRGAFDIRDKHAGKVGRDSKSCSSRVQSHRVLYAVDLLDISFIMSTTASLAVCLSQARYPHSYLCFAPPL